jgi:hypothetical protein
VPREVDRYGSIVNSGETGFLTPTTLANGSLQYKFGNADNDKTDQRRDAHRGELEGLLHVGLRHS